MIEEDESEGQETLVWDIHQSRTWDFFPQGDCFRKQFEINITMIGV